MASSPRRPLRPEAPRPRKGGFGDAGTLGENGALPVAAELRPASEAALQQELSRVEAALAPGAEWKDRVGGLLRLEGLVLGGACADHSTFPDLLLPLRVALEQQLQERRSAVSRQACHVVTVLAETLGPRFEPMAAALMPALFKAQAMCITVVGEAADASARALIRHCPSGRVLQQLGATVLQDKNVKLRQAAAEYLLQALGSWDAGVFARQAAAVELAITAAAQDACAQTREAGRAAFVAYFRGCPEAAAALVRRVPDKDRALREKLTQAANEAVGPGAMVAAAAAGGRARRRASLGGSVPSSGEPSPRPLVRSSSGVTGPMRVPILPLSRPPTPGGLRVGPGALSARGPPTAHSPVLPRRPASAREHYAAEARPPPSAAATPTPLFLRPMPGGSAERAAVRRPVGAGATLRVAVSNEVVSASPDVAASLRGAPSPARRVPRPLFAPTQFAEPLDSARSERGYGRTPLRAAASDAEAQASAVIGFWEEEEPVALPLSECVAALRKAGDSWSSRVDGYAALQAAVRAGGEQMEQEAAAHVEPLVAVLLDGAGDAHFKVATAALEALCEALLSAAVEPLLEPYLERIVPALFARAADRKEEIRQVVADILNAMPARCSPDALLPALARALDINKAPRARCAVLDFFAAAAASGDAELAALAQPGAHSGALLAACAGAATDKNQEVRRCAQRALAAAYTRGDAHAVTTAIEALPASPRAAVTRALTQAMSPAKAEPAPARKQKSPAPSPARRAWSPVGLCAPAPLETLSPAASSPTASSPASSSPALEFLVEPPAASSPPATADSPAESPHYTDSLTDSLANSLDGLTLPSPRSVALPESPGAAARALLAKSALDDAVRAVMDAPEGEGEGEGDERSPQAREAALQAVAAASAAAAPAAVTAAAPALLLRLLHAEADDNLEVAAAAGGAARQVLAVMDASVGASLLMERLPAVDGRPPFEGPPARLLLGVLRHLQPCVRRAAPAQLQPALHLLLPPLCTCYNSASADIRKAALECMVAACLVAGEPAVLPHVAALSAAQHKLLNIYLERAQRAL